MSSLSMALPHSDLLTLLGGLMAVLVAASLVGYVLQRRLSPDGSSAVVENLNDRIRAWWAMVVLMGLALIGGRTGVALLFGFCSFAALREFVTLTNTRRADHWALAAAFFIVLPFQYYLIWIAWYGLYSIFIPVYAFLLMPIVAVLRGDTDHFLVRIAEVQWALMICVFCVSHVPALLSLEIPGYEGRNVLLIAFLVLVVQTSMVVQHLVGRRWPRAPLAPNISSSFHLRSWLIGIVSGGIVGGLISGITPFKPGQALGMALIACIAGSLGHLVMKALRRDRGVPLWGAQGRGLTGASGLLVRVDALCFAAPVFFHSVRWYFGL